jgi:hypothetical protein
MQSWVLLAYRLPREPSTPRITLWRNLRRLGAAQVSDGLVVLPLTEETQEQVEWLATGIEEAGGDASVWLGEAATRAQEERWMERIRQASTEEFEALEQRAIEAEGGDETARRRNLRHLRAELRKARARDYGGVPAGDEAAAAIERLAQSTEVMTP